MCSRGFTLIELMVAIGIMSLLMLGIMSLFLSSTRAMQQGQQAMEANEMCRSAVALMETDLTNAFTARDFGEYYQFFGTPLGFMYVGLVRDSRGVTQMARVTYAVHQFPTDDLNGDGVYQPLGFGADPPEISGNAYSGYFEDRDGNPVYTYSLVRLVELGVEDLESLPLGVPWEALRSDPEFGAVDDSLAEIEFYCDANGCTPAERDALIGARQKELWIQMVAGVQEIHVHSDPADLTSPLVAVPCPSAWQKGLIRTSLGADSFSQDHVLAEGIVPDVTPSPSMIAYTDFMDGSVPPFFTYGRVGTDTTVAPPVTFMQEWPFWNSGANADPGAFAASMAAPDAGLGDPWEPRLPEVVRIRLPFKFESPYIGAKEYVRVIDQVVDVPTAYTRADMTIP